MEPDQFENENIKGKHVKPIREEFFLQVVTHDCVKTAVLKTCFKKKTKKSVVGTLKIYV